LALALLVADPPELLLLDEPTNHLSPRLCDELEAALGGGPGAIVVASHDRWLPRGLAGPRGPTLSADSIRKSRYVELGRLTRVGVSVLASCVGRRFLIVVQSGSNFVRNVGHHRTTIRRGDGG
jgi:hypothetical protein